jgi:hypothetical protein
MCLVPHNVVFYMKTITYSNGEKVESFFRLSGVRPPIFVLVEVDVAAEGPELVRIVSVGKNESGSVERITVKC